MSLCVVCGLKVKPKDQHEKAASPRHVDQDACDKARRNALTFAEGGCDLCDRGFPVEAGQHYGTQSLGMIVTTPCAKVAGVDD